MHSALCENFAVDFLRKMSYNSSCFRNDASDFSYRQGVAPMNESGLMHRLNVLRERLSKLVEETGTFTHPKVIALSQEIDDLVVKLQRQRLNAVKR
ncbi:MAG: hypothetical protein BLM47_11565 [Candidatus Reconcilbacillus cellulovorans]|uniref:Aspartyl-phosphate phosphatase Spo0E family protein n=1 Tax=Candidatus Reconcilbacillus cellulovorans TaxID=1906605 RepID=A0A2A6DXY0_9BACL|nr:MAG: hypothetical protein BLM47_11565 [Candidatus Reconcilbacillus cellulovorans]